jgi:hypothetical protein
MLMVVHRRRDEAPAFAEGFYVVDQATLAIVAGPFEDIGEAEAAASAARLAFHYRGDALVR